MTALQLGPLALPTAPLLWLGALLLAQAVAQGVARRWGDARPPLRQVAGDAFLWAAAAGFAVARLVFVALNADVYLASPWSVLDVRDGGWSPWAGVAVALAVLAWRAARAPVLRRPIAAGTAAAALAWGGASLALGLHERPPLPALALQSPDGTRTDLATLTQGRPAVINLWASWCAPCRVELPAFAAVQQRHGGVRFLFVNQGETAATVQRFLAAQPFTLDGVWLDATAALGPAIGSTGLPTTLFVDAQGRIVERHMGLLNAASLTGRLRRHGLGSPHISPSP